MNTTERNKKKAERKRKARSQESDEQKRIRLQAEADRTREYRTALTFIGGDCKISADTFDGFPMWATRIVTESDTTNVLYRYRNIS